MRRVKKVIGFLYLFLTAVVILSLGRDTVVGAALQGRDVFETLVLILWLALIGIFLIRKTNQMKRKKEDEETEERGNFLNRFKNFSNDSDNEDENEE